MAWCMGSVFPNPDLLTGSAVVPLSSLFLDSPQCFLRTGCTFCHAAQEQYDPHHQVECFLGEYKEAFYPQEVLIESLKEDAPLHSAISGSFYPVGNRLDGVKNKEGRLQLFFPVGENIDRIGSCILFPDLNATCSGINDLQYVSSSSVCQPILQIVANKFGSSCDSELANVPLAARTLYQVHWLTSQIQNDNNSLAWRGVENFSYGTSHVVWNPHFPGETAVVLENGDVIIFDMNAPGSYVASSTFKVQECIGNENLNFAHHVPTHKRKRRKERVQTPRFNNFADSLAPQNWWTCEYSWHPKNLLVGRQSEICLIDMRQKHGGRQFQSSMARIDCSSGSFSYCNRMYRTEHFTALTRAEDDNMFQFAAATTNHLALYDVRRPNTPLLQWEHRMQDEPPQLLQMYCLSDVCSRFDHLLANHGVGGRVILGCSFKSGEIRAFVYGPNPLACCSSSDSIKLGHSMGAMGTLDKLYAWEFPKSLNNGKVHHHKKLEHAFEAHESNLQAPFSKNEQLTGLLNFSPKSEPSSFTILQLTESGAILSQSLRLSEEVGLRNHERPGVVSRKRAIVKTNSGKCGTKQYRMEYFPAFFKYLKYGSFLPKFRQKMYLVANLHQKSTSTDQEECSNKETEEVHASTSVNEAQDNIRRQKCSHYAPARQSLVGNDVQKIQFQRTNSGNDGDQNSEDFFCKMDTQLSPVILSFTDTEKGTGLQSDELLVLSGLKDLFHQWQQNFQPYIDFCSSDVRNNNNC